MKTDLYCQCLLKHEDSYRVGWIPNVFAKKDKILDLKLGNDWSRGWVVVDTGIKVSEEHVLAREQDYKHQREASDI